VHASTLERAASWAWRKAARPIDVAQGQKARSCRLRLSEASGALRRSRVASPRRCRCNPCPWRPADGRRGRQREQRSAAAAETAKDRVDPPRLLRAMLIKASA